MKAVVSRVDRAICTVDGVITGSVNEGLLVTVGFSVNDTEEDVIKTANKIGKVRVFKDDEGKISRSVQDVGGSALVISNFTLYGRLKRTNRPDFTLSCPYEKAKMFFELFEKTLAEYIPVESGVFGAHMHIEALHDGPVNLIVDSSEI